MSTTSVWHELQLAGKALTTRCPSRGDSSIPWAPEKGLAGCTSPTPPILHECTKSSNPQWCGSHWSNPCNGFSLSVKSLPRMMEEQWGSGTQFCRMLWALVTPGLQAAFSLNRLIAPTLVCQDTHPSVASRLLLPGRITAASKISWLWAAGTKSGCLAAHKGLLGYSWPQARLPLLLPALLWPYLD